VVAITVEDLGTWPITVEIRGRMTEGRRVEYREGIEGNHEHSNNLKEEENLESLN